MYSFGERNCWGDLLSRWVNVTAVAVRVVAVFASIAPVKTLPSKDVIREVQQQITAGLSAMVSGALSFITSVCRATKDIEIFSRGAGWSRRVVDPGISEESEDAAHGICSHEEWTPRGRVDFAAATRDQVRQAMSTLHGLEGG